MMIRMLWQQRQMARRDHWTHQQLRAHQARRLAELRRHAVEHSPFYRRFHGGRTDQPLSALPVLTKAMVMEHFDQLVTDPRIRLADLQQHAATVTADQRYLGRYRVVATGGTTGRPGLFLFDGRAWAELLAGSRGPLFAHTPNDRPGRPRSAQIGSAHPLHLSRRGALTVRNPLLPLLLLSALDPVPVLVDRLNAFQPTNLTGYPSLLAVLADEQLAGRLQIAPAHVFTTSEVLTADVRARVREAFGSEPYDQYVTTEAGAVGAECTQHAGLHLFEDQTIIEVVDDHHQPVPAGRFGAKLLVTVLYNQTQPLIRYELDDSLRLAPQPCGCGRPYPLAHSVQGRTQDVLQLPRVGGGQVAVHPLVFHQVMEQAPTAGWQVVHEPGRLRLLVVAPGAGFNQDLVRTTLTAELRRLRVQDPAVVVERTDSIPRTPNGKVRLVVSSPTTTGADATQAGRRVPNARR